MQTYSDTESGRTMNTMTKSCATHQCLRYPPIRMTSTIAIKTFFEKNGGRKVTLNELNALSSKERRDMGALAAAKLGVTLADAPQERAKR